MAAIVVAVAFAGAGSALAQKKKSSKPTAEDKKENKEELGLKGKTVAKSDIDAKSASKLKGKATFTDDGKGGITFRLEVSDAAPGQHAVHIHEKGDCSSPDGKSAGDHWNPMHEQHGKWGGEGGHFHLGDIGNLEVKPDGKGTLTLETNKWSAGGGAVNDIVGHAVVVHGGVDDFKSQPAGNAGPRIGCGVIMGEGKPAAGAPSGAAAKPVK
jgi:Cu-Zn family superoxide dismutase